MPKLFFLKSTDWFDDIKAIDIIKRETNDTNFLIFMGLQNNEYKRR